MRAKLEFNLPEEFEEYKASVDGLAWKCVVHEMDEWLRGQIKYHGKGFEEVRKQLREMVEDRELTLE